MSLYSIKLLSMLGQFNETGKCSSRLVYSVIAQKIACQYQVNSASLVHCCILVFSLTQIDQWHKTWLFTDCLYCLLAFATNNVRYNVEYLKEE